MYVTQSAFFYCLLLQYSYSMVVPIRQFIAQNKRLLLIGGITAVVLVFFIIQRSQSAAGETGAFHLSEAGLHYALHLFNSGACTPQELLDTTIVQTVPNAEETGTVGKFALTIDSRPTEPVTRWQVTARGHLDGQMGACQEIVADVESFSGALGTKYRTVSWEQHDVTWCVEAASTTEVTCVGQEEK